MCLGYRVSLGVSNCGWALVASRLSGWPGEISQYTGIVHKYVQEQEQEQDRQGSMGRIPLSPLVPACACLSAFPALTIAGTRPAGAHPAGPLGHPHLVDPVGFGWRGACALFCSLCSHSLSLASLSCPLHPLHPPQPVPLPVPNPSVSPVPRAQCQRGTSHAMPCFALPCRVPCFPKSNLEGRPPAIAQ